VGRSALTGAEHLDADRQLGPLGDNLDPICIESQRMPNADYARSRKQAPDMYRPLPHVTDPASGGSLGGHVRGWRRASFWFGC
jgi:hypothetical protein